MFHRSAVHRFVSCKKRLFRRLYKMLYAHGSTRIVGGVVVFPVFCNIYLCHLATPVILHVVQNTYACPFGSLAVRLCFPCSAIHISVTLPDTLFRSLYNVHMHMCDAKLLEPTNVREQRHGRSCGIESRCSINPNWWRCVCVCPCSAMRSSVAFTGRICSGGCTIINLCICAN